MQRAFTILLIISLCAISMKGQNLVQNPGFENLPDWDEFWFLSLTDPSTPSAVATQNITEAYEGVSSVELSNTVASEWTYFYSDVRNAPIRLQDNRSYHVQAWVKSLEEGKKVRLKMIYDGGNISKRIYADNPNPGSHPDWFLVEGIVTPKGDYNDAYLSLEFNTGKDKDKNPVGRVLFDHISVTLMPDGTDAEIHSFYFKGQYQTETIDPVLGTIHIGLPHGTDLSALAPDSITLSRGAIMSPDIGVVRDFRNPVVYTVTSQDGQHKKDWTVYVSVLPPSSATAITSFDLPELIAPATINKGVQLVLGRVPFGTDVRTLVPSIEVSRGASIDPAPGVPTDFTNPVTYIVVAEDRKTVQDWVAAILVEQNTATDITSFHIPELLGSAIIDTSNHTVEGTVPFGTDLTALVPNIEVSEGGSIDPQSGLARDFSSPVVYTVTADDNNFTQDWTVTIREGAASTETDILSFSIPELDAPAIINTTLHTVDGQVPYGTDLNGLIPTIGVSPGASIDPASGVARDFSSPVSYAVTAQDGTTVQDWTINLQILPNDATDILSFHIPELVAAASINETLHTVVGTVPYGTDLSALIPDIVVSDGASINPDPGTATDFTSPVSYTITAEDGSTTQTWVVSILVEPNTETDITEFSLAEQTDDPLIDPAGHTVQVEVVHGTNLGFLTPIISVSTGASIDPSSGVSRDFTSALTYTVTAEDGISIQTWTVIVTLAPANTETDITGFSIPQLVGPAIIDPANHTVAGSVDYGVDLSARVPTINVSTGATIDPASGVITDFSAPVTYTVTAQDGTTTQDWVVSIQALPNTETDILSFSMAEATGPCTINSTDHSIEMEVASGSDLSTLVPTIEVSAGATIDPPSGSNMDFTSPVDYTVTAEDGVSSQIWRVSVKKATALGIGDQSLETIRIYPNPASDFLFVELRSPAHIRMHDLMGKLHYSADHVNGEQRISVSDFKDGIYIVSLHMQDGSVQQSKVIIR